MNSNKHKQTIYFDMTVQQRRYRRPWIGGGTAKCPKIGRGTAKCHHNLGVGTVDKPMNQRHSSDVFRIATWNIGSLTGRITELVNIMKKRRIDVIGLQETKWKGRKARLLSDGYKLLYMGSNTKQNGVAIILAPHLAKNMISIDRKNDRMMMVKLALENIGIWNFIVAYAPQTGCSPDEKQEFWNSLEGFLETIPSNEKRIVLADLNGHVGKVTTDFESVHGGFGFGVQNAQGLDILNFAVNHNLALVNTFFTKQDRHLMTYSSGHNNTQIDYILCDLDLRKQFKDCKVILGEPLTTQHRLLLSEMKLPSPLKRKDTAHVTPKIKWHRLKEDISGNMVSKLQEFMSHDVLCSEATSITPNDMWNKFQKICIDEATKTLGVSKGRLKNDRESWWWNDVVQEAVKWKKMKFKDWKLAEGDPNQSEETIANLKQEYKMAKKKSKIAVAKSRSEASEKLYEELDTVEGQKAIYKIAGARQRKAKDIINAKYIRDENGTLLTEDSAIRNRWKEYNECLLNQGFPRNDTVLNDPVLGAVHEISSTEVQLAVSQMKNGKATGPDQIPAEIWKHLGSIGNDWLTLLFNKILNNDPVPEAFEEGFLVPIYKQKGDASLCGNYRGLMLKSHTSKILEHVLNSRLKSIVNIHSHQCGFVAGRSTVDAIQTLRIVIEKARDNKQDLHIAYLDLEKAFDRVPRDIVWEALRWHNVPEQLVQTIQNMYSNLKARVRCTAGVTDDFGVQMGVSQGSALSPLLFILVVNYLTFHLMEDLPWVLIYADDVALVAHTKDQLESSLEKWRDALESNGLRISRTKTEYMYLKFNENHVIGPQDTVRLDSEPLKMTDSFTYLGSVLSSDGKCDQAVNQRIQAGWLKWRSVSGVLCDNRMPIKLKGKIYNTIVKPALLYASETWTRQQTHTQKMQVTENKMLRWSGGVTTFDKVRNEYLYGSFGIGKNVAAKLEERQMSWFGHVLRREQEHITQKAINIPEQRRGRGRPKDTWLRKCKKKMENANLTVGDAQNRRTWQLRSRTVN